MTLVEVMVSSVVFALAANGSVKLWGSALAWNHRAQQRQELLRQIDMELLQRERAMRLAAAAQVEAAGAAGAEVPMSCANAAEWMGLQLSTARSSLPAGIVLTPESAETEGAGALWLTATADGIERKRLFAPAAHGLCRP